MDVKERFRKKVQQQQKQPSTSNVRNDLVLDLLSSNKEKVQKEQDLR